MRNKILLLTCIFLCSLLATNAQYHQLTGVVTTAKDHRPVAYAHVGIPARGMGVVSNEVGAFTLNYPAAYAKDSLKVSCLGFKTYTIALSKVQQEDTLRIYLKPEVLELAGEIIKPIPTRGGCILYSSLKRLKKNYPIKVHQLNAFNGKRCKAVTIMATLA